MEKKDTENMEMKKPEEQAKPKKKKIISVVRPQNATSKEAKEFTKNQGQKKAVRPAETAVRKETAMETEEARTVRTVETERRKWRSSEPQWRPSAGRAPFQQ